MVNPFTIISSRFLASSPLCLSIVRDQGTLTRGNYTVTDANGRVMFRVQGSRSSPVSRRVLLDADGTPILSFQTSQRYGWDVYKGESKEKIFSTIRSPLIPYNTSLEVFLGSNPKRLVCDFRVEGSWFNQSCTIYAQDFWRHLSGTTVAKMQKNPSFKTIALGNNRFDVTVYPNVDYAFIVALVVILDQSRSHIRGNAKRFRKWK